MVIFHGELLVITRWYIYIFLVGGLEHGFYDFSIQLGKNIKPLKKHLKNNLPMAKPLRIVRGLEAGIHLTELS